MTKIPKHLPNLDSIRAIAALLVFIWHVELIKISSGINGVIKLHDLGGIAVTIFFVLSGFLITHLLNKEYSSNGNINLTRFYFRRILRIWPLYFLILYIGVFIYPGSVPVEGITLSIFFLPNIAFVLGKLPALIDPIWSLGVEEQFYIFFPHLFRFKSKIKTFNVLLLSLLFLLSAKYFAKYLHMDLLQNILYFARFDCMLIGAIFSIWISNYLQYNSEIKVLISPKIILSKTFQILNLIALFSYVLICMNFNNVVLNHQIFAAFTAVAISNLAFNKFSVVTIENKIFNFIGKISFGFYLIHKFPVYFLTQLSIQWEIPSGLLQNTFIYTFSLFSTIVLAFLTFKYFESPFLSLKEVRFGSMVNSNQRS